MVLRGPGSEPQALRSVSASWMRTDFMVLGGEISSGGCMQGALVRWRELSLAQREEHGPKWVVKRQRGDGYEKRRKWMNSRSILEAESWRP